MKRRPYPETKPSGVDWLGDVPGHWELLALGRVIELQRGVDITKEDQQEGEVPVVSSGGIASTHEVALAPAPGVVVGRKGTAGSLFYIDVPFWPHDTTLWVRQFHGNLPKFVYYKLASMDLASFDTGAANPTLNRNLLHPVLVAWPPLPEQTAIADFLDRETAKIDALTERKRTLIERLREKRAALVSRTVARGLPPEAARAAGLPPNPALKPSGVDWLGDVPAHWEVRPLKRFVRVRGGATPDKSKPEYWDGSIPWVSAKDMKVARIADTEDHVSQESLANSPLVLLPPCSLLIVVRGMILAHTFPVALTEVPLTINQDLKALLARPGVVPEFLFWMLSGIGPVFVTLTDESAHGTRKLESEVLARFSVALPPLPEQTAIADFLDRETAKIDALIAKVEAAVDRLREYRTALITAAVTGRIDVRGAAA